MVSRFLTLFLICSFCMRTVQSNTNKQEHTGNEINWSDIAQSNPAKIFSLLSCIGLSIASFHNAHKASKQNSVLQRLSSTLSKLSIQLKHDTTLPPEERTTLLSQVDEIKSQITSARKKQQEYQQTGHFFGIPALFMFFALVGQYSLSSTPLNCTTTPKSSKKTVRQ